MGQTTSMSGGGGGDFWSWIGGQVMGGSSGGSTEGVYGTDTVSNILGPLTPQYWANAASAQQARDFEQEQQKIKSKAIKLQTRKMQEDMNRQKRIRELAYGYR